MLTVIIGAIVGAVLGALCQWLLDARDRKRVGALQDKMVTLEAERNRLEQFVRFQPRISIVDGTEKNTQVIRVEADEPLQVESMDYLNEKGARVASQAVDSQLATTIDVPINERSLNEVRDIGPIFDAYDRSAHVIFRLHVRKDGQYKQIQQPAVAKQYFDGNVGHCRAI